MQSVADKDDTPANPKRRFSFNQDDRGSRDMRSSTTRNASGFTLMELMIVIAIVAILAALALPSYMDYVVRSKIRTAQADLQAWSAVVENYRQRQLKWPADQTVALVGFKPASKSTDFGFTYSTASGYTLTATGASGKLNGCTLTVTADNTRTVGGGCPSVGDLSW